MARLSRPGNADAEDGHGGGDAVVRPDAVAQLVLEAGNGGVHVVDHARQQADAHLGKSYPVLDALGRLGTGHHRHREQPPGGGRAVDRVDADGQRAGIPGQADTG